MTIELLEVKTPETISSNAIGTIVDGTSEVFSRRDERSNNWRWLSDALAEVEGLRSLAANWDSYGAAAVDTLSVNRAKAYLKSLPRRPTITATPDGNVLFCWETNELELDAEIFPNGAIEYLYEHRAYQTEPIESSTDDIERIAALL